ncbi:MAG TPA: SPOR domain-containing protein, partial [Phnomibacter sp.]|nr:SPOR domain-containing protein [Phnomibacter sp.]
LTRKQHQINKVTTDANALAKYKTSGGKYKGYRLMVLNTNNRDLAYQTRGQLASRFPQHTLYLGYQAPYYKLKMGDFLEKNDAEALKKQLSGILKQGIFVIPDAVNLKPEEEEKLLEKLSKGNTN